MKITKIEYKELLHHVTFEPNFLERLFGVKSKVVKYRNSGATFTYGGGSVYYREDGKKLGNGDWVGETIDKWRNSF